MEDWLSLFEDTKEKYIEDFKKDIAGNPDLLEQDVFDKIIRPKTEIYEKNYCRFKDDLFDSFRSLFINIENNEQINKRINKFIKYDIPNVRDKNQGQFDLTTNSNARLNTWDYEFLSADANSIVEYLIERYILWKIRNRDEGFEILSKPTKVADQLIDGSELTQKQFAILISLLIENGIIDDFSEGNKTKELNALIKTYSPNNARSVVPISPLMNSKPSGWKKDDLDHVLELIRKYPDINKKINNTDYLLNKAI